MKTLQYYVLRANSGENKGKFLCTITKSKNQTLTCTWTRDPFTAIDYPSQEEATKAQGDLRWWVVDTTQLRVSFVCEEITEDEETL